MCVNTVHTYVRGKLRDKNPPAGKPSILVAPIDGLAGCAAVPHHWSLGESVRGGGPPWRPPAGGPPPLALPGPEGRVIRPARGGYAAGLLAVPRLRSDSCLWWCVAGRNAFLAAAPCQGGVCIRMYSTRTVHPTPPLEASLAAHPPALQPPTYPPQEVACTAPLHAAHQGALAGRGSSRERAEGEGAGPAGGRAPARWGRHAAPSRTVEAQVARLGSHSPPAHHTHFMGLTPSSTK